MPSSIRVDSGFRYRVSTMRFADRRDEATAAERTVRKSIRGAYPIARACVDPSAALDRACTPAPGGTEAVMVAGGYGLATFRLFSEELRRASRPGRVFYGGRTLADLQLRDGFAPLGMPLVPATEDGSLGVRGRVTVPLEAPLDGRPGPVRLYPLG